MIVFLLISPVWVSAAGMMIGCRGPFGFLSHIYIWLLLGCCVGTRLFDGHILVCNFFGDL